ncbi:MAG: PHP domain-containing protein [Thermoanaerobacteraceae bacterium]|nr:PHP domain-containing protein [Thermoanaerobacteraceae bacterium]
MYMAVDLHTHTTASDGALSPKQLVAKAINCGLEGIAITDHDTIGGVEEALAAARGKSFIVIPGIEFSTDWNDEEVHVLGYFIDYRNSRLLQLLEKLEESRWRRGQKMVRKLNNAGLTVDWNQVAAMAENGVVGRPHVAQVLVEAGYVSSIAEAFEKYLGKGRPGYVPRFKLTPRDAVREVKNAGGIPVLAHPGLLKRQEKLTEVLTWGFAGIEVYYPEHSKEQTKYFNKLAEQHNLIATGGSDYHGETREKNFLGAATVAKEVVQKLLDLREGRIQWK